MNEHTKALHQRGLQINELAQANGLTAETVSRAVKKHGLGHPKISEWIEKALNAGYGKEPKQAPTPMTAETVAEETPVDGIEIFSLPSQGNWMQQIDMFRAAGYKSVQASADYQEAKMEHDTQRVAFINSRRDALEEDGQKVVETRLTCEALQNPNLNNLLRQMLLKRADAERARINYLIMGYQLAGTWPPLHDLKGDRLWM